MSRRHQLAAATITLLCLCLMLVSWTLEWVRRGNSIDIERPPDVVGVELKIDINRAAWPELTLLPEISETMARRIVTHRQRNGPFESLESIMEGERDRSSNTRCYSGLPVPGCGIWSGAEEEIVGGAVYVLPGHTLAVWRDASKISNNSSTLVGSQQPCVRHQFHLPKVTDHCSS